MSQDYYSLTVVFEKNLSEETVEHLSNAILQFQNVLSVEKNPVDILSDHVAERRVKAELCKAVIQTLYPNS